ncbi:hypothetical protein D3C87_1644160 [compost metagenome]
MPVTCHEVTKPDSTLPSLVSTTALPTAKPRSPLYPDPVKLKVLLPVPAVTAGETSAVRLGPVLFRLVAPVRAKPSLHALVKLAFGNDVRSALMGAE